jgi:uncharacterized protein YlxW (UPF0749 family)
MDKRNVRYIMFVVFLLLGIIVAIQFRSIMDERAAGRLDTTNEIQKLIEIIDAEKKAIADLEKQLEAELQREAELEQQFVMQQKDKSLEVLYNELQETRLKAALLDVAGPGLIIKLDDAVARQNMDKGSLVIHDSDIKALLNELKIAGAQAISINGERIIATSEQICAGPTIRINWRKYAVPYVINVIGDPDKLNRALKNSRRFAYMMRDGIKIDIRTTKNVVVPGFRTGGENIDTYISLLEVVDDGA